MPKFIALNYYNLNALTCFCKIGDFERIQYFIHYFEKSIKSPFPLFNEVYYIVFQLICKFGHIHIAKWLLNNKPILIPLFIKNIAFRETCANGHLHVAKWLFEMNPTINIIISDVFLLLCPQKYPHIIQWFLTIQPTLNTLPKKYNKSFRRYYFVENHSKEYTCYYHSNRLCNFSENVKQNQHICMFLKNDVACSYTH